MRALWRPGKGSQSPVQFPPFDVPLHTPTLLSPSSLQKVPKASGPVHAFAVSSHESSQLAGMSSPGHGLPPLVHVPVWQLSTPVQKSPSVRQAEPLGSGSVQRPVTGSHDSLQSVSASPTKVAQGSPTWL